MQATGASTNLNQVIQLGYDGIVLDLEEYVSGQTVSIPDWNQLFPDIKAHNLLVSSVMGKCAACRAAERIDLNPPAPASDASLDAFTKQQRTVHRHDQPLRPVRL